MLSFPLNTTGPQSLDGLVAFLKECRKIAVSKGRSQLVSISAEADALDPLAVLDSIYDPNELHFYLEQRKGEIALAGAEELLACRPSGKNRFAEAKRFIEETLENAIAVGDPESPFFGPRFFCAFSFFDETGTGEAFPASMILVPRWLVGLQNGKSYAMANAMIGADSDIESIAARIWGANTKFRSFDYGASSHGKRLEKLAWNVSRESELAGAERFSAGVSSALAEIERGAYEKIVLARTLELKGNQPFHPLEILNTLRERYADCYAFSIANGKGQSFIGASPERMIKRTGDALVTEALAGSAPRGESASEDAALGRALLNSDKDRREHNFVLSSTCRRLSDIGVPTTSDAAPRLKKLSNVQHLHSEIVGQCPAGLHLLDIVEKLHPTPAVGGTPKEAVLSRITELEGFSRGLYAGPIGWIDGRGDGEFLVAIRSALIDGDRASLYAGAGIVRGSVPEKEIQETKWKFNALMENLQ